MKLAVQCALNPTREQRAMLLDTMRRVNAAANYAAVQGFASGENGRAALARLTYRSIRSDFGLTSRLTDKAIAKTIESFRRDRRTCPIFRPTGAVPFDSRNMRLVGATVSMGLVGGRTRIPFIVGEYQQCLLPNLKGESDLVYRDGRFYLYMTADVPDPPPIIVSEFVGVDLGIANVAVTSDGEVFTGTAIEAVRLRSHDRRRRLNREATRQRKAGKRPRGVRRAQLRLGRKESRFKRHENHVISKQVVRLAKGTKRGIAVENLRHIRSRIRFAKAQRARTGGWAFGQLQDFLAYKAKRAGIPFVVVNARYTSQTCFACGHCDRENRPDQASFVCTACGHSAHADLNAAQNIAARAAVVPPKASGSPQRIAA